MFNSYCSSDIGAVEKGLFQNPLKNTNVCNSERNEVKQRTGLTDFVPQDGTISVAG
jgi:hypothetical protein